MKFRKENNEDGRKFEEVFGEGLRNYLKKF